MVARTCRPWFKPGGSSTTESQSLCSQTVLPARSHLWDRQSAQVPLERHSSAPTPSSPEGCKEAPASTELVVQRCCSPVQKSVWFFTITRSKTKHPTYPLSETPLNPCDTEPVCAALTGSAHLSTFLWNGSGLFLLSVKEEIITLQILKPFPREL